MLLRAANFAASALLCILAAIGALHVGATARAALDHPPTCQHETCAPPARDTVPIPEAGHVDPYDPI